jgi:hypothetical protein
MQNLEGSGTPVLYIGRTVLKGYRLEFLLAYSFPPPSAQYCNYYSGNYAFVLEILFT